MAKRPVIEHARLILTCQRRKAEPLRYLRETLTHIAATTMNRRDKLRPGSATIR